METEVTNIRLQAVYEPVKEWTGRYVSDGFWSDRRYQTKGDGGASYKKEMAIVSYRKYIVPLFLDYTSQSWRADLYRGDGPNLGSAYVAKIKVEEIPADGFDPSGKVVCEAGSDAWIHRAAEEAAIGKTGQNRDFSRYFQKGQYMPTGHVFVEKY